MDDDEIVAQAFVFGIGLIGLTAASAARTNEARKKRTRPLSVRACFVAFVHVLYGGL